MPKETIFGTQGYLKLVLAATFKKNLYSTVIEYHNVAPKHTLGFIGNKGKRQGQIPLQRHCVFKWDTEYSIERVDYSIYVCDVGPRGSVYFLVTCRFT